MRPARLLPFLVVPLLAACVNDSAVLETGDKLVTLSLLRQQKWPWDKKVDFSLIVGRMPSCQRRHPLGSASRLTKVEVWQPRDNVFILVQGSRMYATEANTCEGWAKIEGEPEGGFGDQLGTFQEKDGKLQFVVAAPEGKPAGK